jgi:hypothetical protein
VLGVSGPGKARCTRVGDCAWLTVPLEVVSSVVQQLKRKREKLVAEDGKLLVKIARIITATHDDTPDFSSLPTHHFIVWTEEGPIESTFSIDQLQLCHPPPAASMYRVVDLELPTADTPSPKSKPMKLTKAYKRFLALQASRAAIAARNQVNAAVQVATSINSCLNDLASSMMNIAAAQPAQPAVVVVDRAMTPPPDVGSSPPMSIPVVDLEPYPCSHCGVTVEFSGCSFCFYTPCRAPFHRPGTGCAKEDKMFVVDTELLYCRQACAQLDRTDGNRRSDQDRLQRDPISADQQAQEPMEEVINTGIVQSQTSEVETGKSAIICKSCLQPMSWKQGTGCDKCRGYHHKVKKNQDGCTRGGWTKGGSRNVEGSVECVACRFAGDRDWKRFCEQNNSTAC